MCITCIPDPLHRSQVSEGRRAGSARGSDALQGPQPTPTRPGGPVTVRYGKSPSLNSVNQLFLWVIFNSKPLNYRRVLHMVLLNWCLFVAKMTKFGIWWYLTMWFVVRLWKSNIGFGHEDARDRIHDGWWSVLGTMNWSMMGTIKPTTSTKEWQKGVFSILFTWVRKLHGSKSRNIQRNIRYFRQPKLGRTMWSSDPSICCSLDVGVLTNMWNRHWSFWDVVQNTQTTSIEWVRA